MNSSAAASVFSAIGHPTRLKALDLVRRAGPSGLGVGEVAARLKVSDALASSHLRILAAADLIRQHRVGKTIISTFNPKRINALSDFLKAMAAI